MTNKTPIQNREDIELLVNAFYGKVMRDDVIGYIFTDVAKISLDKHLPIMYSFWESMLLGNMNYKGNPMSAHLALNRQTPLTPEHFTRWKKLFFKTLDTYFIGEKVDEAKKRIEGIEALMLHKIEQSNMHR